MILPCSLDDMLLTIARDNKITKFFFYVFTPALSKDYQPIITGSEKVAVRSSELRNRLSHIRDYARRNDKLVGITSPVEVKGRKNLHMNLLDIDNFSWFTSKDELIDWFKLPHGFLLNSGSGYHFYGRDLVDEKGWRKSLLRAKKDFDENWARGQLNAGKSMLRITSNSSKKYEPVVIAASGYDLVKKNDR